MSEQAMMLLVARDERLVETFRSTIELERQVKLVVAPDGTEGLRMARDLRPDLVVIAADVPNTNVFSFCQQVKQDPALEPALLVMIIEADANDMRFAGLTFGVDEYLVRPVAPAEVLTKLRAASRLKRMSEQIRADRQRLDDLHRQLRESFDQMLQLMANMLDMRLPGAASRGQRIAELALKVSARFGVPQTHLRDMELAARLHELGRVVSTDDRHAEHLSKAAVNDWQYILGTRALFQKIVGLGGAADLIGAVYENWDGTGRPDHMQQGQIPLRSRILRVLIDLFTELDAPDRPPMEHVLDDLQKFVGTRYDPMVMVHLRAVLSGAADGDVQGKQMNVPVPELRVGMVIAQDLFTESGIKLLAKDTRITLQTLEVIRRRHSLEPIVQGALVYRASA
jgi:response regulator RpfG family c-di-GMP phosphodiesterase